MLIRKFGSSIIEADPVCVKHNIIQQMPLCACPHGEYFEQIVSRSADFILVANFDFPVNLLFPLNCCLYN